MNQHDNRLTSFTAFAGCGAKLGPEFLDRALCDLTQPIYPNVLSDFSHAEDCGVYKVSDDIAVVNTLDFFHLCVMMLLHLEELLQQMP